MKHGATTSSRLIFAVVTHLLCVYISRYLPKKCCEVAATDPTHEKSWQMAVLFPVPGQLFTTEHYVCCILVSYSQQNTVCVVYWSVIHNRTLCVLYTGQLFTTEHYVCCMLVSYSQQNTMCVVYWSSTTCSSSNHI